MSPRLVKLLVTLLAAWAAVVGGAGIAAAHFTASGTGSGGAGTATLQPVTAVAGTGASALHPGGIADAVVVLTNLNAYEVVVAEVAPIAGAPVTATGGVGACTTPEVSFDAPAVSALEELAPLTAGGTTTIVLPGAVSMGTGSESGCQGAAFTIPITVGVVR